MTCPHWGLKDKLYATVGGVTYCAKCWHAAGSPFLTEKDIPRDLPEREQGRSKHRRVLHDARD